MCCVCQYGKQLQCNYQLSKSTPLVPLSLEGRRLTEVRRSPAMLNVLVYVCFNCVRLHVCSQRQRPAL